jgi:hypothetical protein
MTTKTKRKPVKSFTIDRKIWLRGIGPEQSLLLRESDCKKCCLGIYGTACGIPDKAMLNVESPDQVKNSFAKRFGQWMFDGYDDVSDVCSQLMTHNDNESLKPKEREKRITAGFAKAGIKVRFKN